VRRYQTVECGGSIFVLLDDRHENGFTAFMRSVAATHVFVPGFSVDLLVEPEYVIENVFDADHFKTVHGLTRTPRLELGYDGDGELVVEAVFETRAANVWQDDDSEAAGARAQSRFCAHVFSPTLVASELGERGRSHIVVTAATPAAERTCTARVSIAVLPDKDGNADAATAEGLIWASKRAFQQDAGVWEHLVAGAPTRYAATDGPVIEYRAFCRRFLDDR
jgi:phenylpropionate dioxygenase-like ring-hydroxylating dioxygenase large terminal subunit